MRRPWRLCAVLASAAVAAGIVLLTVLPGGQKPADAFAGYQSGAEQACKNFIFWRIDMRHTALFSDFAYVPHAPTYDDVTVHVTVDARDPSNAPIHETVTCQMYLDGATWQLESLIGLDQV